MLAPTAKSDKIARRIYQQGAARAPKIAIDLATPSISFSAPAKNPVISMIEDEGGASSLGCVLGRQTGRGRCTVQAFADGKRRAIAKYDFGSTQDAQLANEAAMLEFLSGEAILRESVPRLIGMPSFHLGTVLVTDGFNGSPHAPQIDPALRIWLQRCEEAACGTGEGLIRRTLSKVAGDERIAGLVGDSARTLREQRPLPAVVHGDLAPWNIVSEAGLPRIFDWEYGCRDGLAFWDEVCFISQTGIVIHRHGSEAIAAKITQAVNRSPGDVRASRMAVARMALADMAMNHAAVNKTASRELACEAAERLPCIGAG